MVNVRTAPRNVQQLQGSNLNEYVSRLLEHNHDYNQTLSIDCKNNHDANCTSNQNNFSSNWSNGDVTSNNTSLDDCNNTTATHSPIFNNTSNGSGQDTSTSTVANTSTDGVRIVSLVYVFVFFFGFLLPCLYYIRCVLDGRRKSEEEDEVGDGSEAASSSSPRRRRQHHSHLRLPPPRTSRRGITTFGSSRNLSGATSNANREIDIAAFLMDTTINPQVDSLQILYLQEKQGQIHQLLAPYTMVRLSYFSRSFSYNMFAPNESTF